jgi:hypothetical protein
MRSPPGWWTSTTCSSGRSWWAAGEHFLPDRARLQLELLGERRFGIGVVSLRYRTQT